jgi:hypothetical protein
MKPMTDTPAESAEVRALREELNVTRNLVTMLGRDLDAARAALAALNTQWKEALQKYEGCAYWIAAEQHSCPKCAPLRALLSEGKPGK